MSWYVHARRWFKNASLWIPIRKFCELFTSSQKICESIRLRVVRYISLHTLSSLETMITNAESFLMFFRHSFFVSQVKYSECHSYFCYVWFHFIFSKTCFEATSSVIIEHELALFLRYSIRKKLHHLKEFCVCQQLLFLLPMTPVLHLILKTYF